MYGAVISALQSHFLGLVTFPIFSVPHINSTTIWHNYTIFFAILKGRFESFLLLDYNVILSLFEIRKHSSSLWHCKFPHTTPGCVPRINRVFLFLKLYQMTG